MTRAKLTPFAWLFGGKQRLVSATRQRPRRASMVCESLEGRVVLSQGGFAGFEAAHGLSRAASLTSDLAELGVLTNFSSGLELHRGARVVTSSTSQLAIDLEKLETDLRAVAAKSTVTIADIAALSADDRALRESGFRPDADQLESAVISLARAIASGGDVSAAKTEFDAVFAGSSVTQETVDKAFADLSRAIANSKITTAEIDTILADRAAVKADREALQSSGPLVARHEDGSATLLASVAKLGVLGGFGEGFGNVGRTGFRNRLGNTGSTTLATDLEKLRTDLESLATKSGVTVSEITSLKLDGQTIAQTGFRPDVAKLDAAVSELAIALVSEADATQAKTDFAAVFAGSTVSREMIDKTIADLSQAITDSNVTQSDLATIAADRAALKADLEGLKNQTTSGSTSSSSTSTANKPTKATTTSADASSNATVSRRARLRARAMARRARS